MIEFIGIRNFKTLLDANFPLGQLNIFSGLNGMGKSSLIQTLLLLRQSHEKNVLWTQGVLLNGDYVNLGTNEDVLSAESEEEAISFVIKWQERKTASHFDFTYDQRSDLLPLAVGNEVTSFSKSFTPASQVALFDSRFRYLSAERLGPRSQHSLSEFSVKHLNSLGKHGEYTVHYMAENARKTLSIEELQHPKANSDVLGLNVDAWMSEITPGLKVNAVTQPHLNSASLSFSFRKGRQHTTEFKPQNVGFGLSYVLPVVVCLLSAKVGDLVIIENPESHLHPAGQAVMGRLCALAAEHGVQLLVESHSDHFLNGVRVAAHEQIIQPDNVQLFFLQRESGSDIHASEVLNPQLDELGRIDEWPEGFFDEWDRQLDRLL